MILDWRTVAATILDQIRREITFTPQSDRPMLAVVLVGANPASEAYVRMKERRAREVGMYFWLYRYSSDISEEELIGHIRSLSENEKIHGIIVQAPLPAHIDRMRVTEAIDPEKDVDGFTRVQVGNMYLGRAGLWSCTPKGVMTLLDAYHISVQGKHVVVLGRSNIVGKPMTLMLIGRGATVTNCNSSTPNLTRFTHSADIIISAVGKPGFLTSDMVSPDVTIIDVGSTFVDGVGKGDADFESLKHQVSAITPVPGGVGPMTVATLIANTWQAYQNQR